MSDHPARRFAFMVLFQAQQDRATQLVINPAADSGFSIKYQVEGRWHEFAPPPPHILPGAIAELERLAGIEGEEFPKAGIIDASYGTLRLHWKMRIKRPGEACVLAPIASG